MAQQVDSGDALDDAAYLRARYGTVPTSVRYRRMVVVAVVIGAACIAWSVWIGVADAGRAKAETIGFDLQGGKGATVTFDITMDPGERAVCTLRALNERSVEVGRADVSVPASARATQRVKGSLPTSEPAVSAMVQECALVSTDD